jgi:hypothetical protein
MNADHPLCSFENPATSAFHESVQIGEICGLKNATAAPARRANKCFNQMSAEARGAKEDQLSALNSPMSIIDATSIRNRHHFRIG